MKTPKFLDRRVGSSLAAIGMLLGLVVPAAVPAFASAAQLSARSLELSSSAAAATSVDYHLKFTAPSAVAAAGGLVLEFCDDSPLVGLACNHPSGMTTAGVSITDLKINNVSSGTDGTVAAVAGNYGIKWTAGTGGYAATDTIDLYFAGITNPTAANSNLYGRIVTYADSTNLAGYTDADTLGTYADDGAVATSITNSIGVSAAVKETMTFCVSALAPGRGCGAAGQTPTAPNIILGQGSPQSLDSATVSTAGVYAQLSTNAASGAVVNMKNSTGCGGLKRIGAAGCDIQPVGVLATLTAAQADGKFGLRVGTPVETDTGEGFGTVTPDAYYDSGAQYAMNSTDVSGTYGDAIFASTAAVGNMNVPLTFGAVAGLTTPAGQYSASINLIATGTY